MSTGQSLEDQGGTVDQQAEASGDYERLRQRHLQELEPLVPEHLERISWPVERLRSERTAQLRTLLTVAKERSPWHQARLADIDPSELDESDLASLPTMTKEDVMAHFDEIVTDRRLTLELVESHLAGLSTDAYLLDRFHAVASSGSSGRRGAFVWSWESWPHCYLGFIRYSFREQMRDPELAGRPLVLASVTADHLTHISSALQESFRSPALVIHRFPVALPLEQIVEGLNETQPDVVNGYPSALYQLALEAQAGRLRIAPKAICGTGEPLLPEIRAALEETWTAAVNNWWGSSEGGPMGISCGHGAGMHLSEDLHIVEPVDTNGNEIPVGTRSAKIYLTNLINHALPLIRYELTDEVTLLEEPCPCGSVHRQVADIQGRLDDSFAYPNVGTIHPYVFGARLGQERNIVQYQVRQTARGAAIEIRCAGEVDSSQLQRDIAGQLERHGLADPELSITPVEHFDRQTSGKLKRFIPLPAA